MKKVAGFRYRYPREGTETRKQSITIETHHNLDIDIPERGRKRESFIDKHLAFHLDIDIPERGRKLILASV